MPAELPAVLPPVQPTVLSTVLTAHLTPELVARLASQLPDGRSPENVRIITAQGTIVRDPSDLSSVEQALIASQFTAAGGPPKVTNGRPTIMRVVAWLGHEGVNNNRLAFVADELGAAADRIREPNFLLMDFNHSAVLPFVMEQKAIGVWYRAEKRWDPNAKDGRGAYGILAEGMMWAWAFPEYADRMLADQERDGVLNFSMACVPETLETGRDENGPFDIAHNPVFLTLSALDVAPADKNAVGLGVEGSDDPDLEAKLTTELVGATDSPPLNVLAPFAASARTDQLTEAQMDELKQTIAALTAQLEAANTKLAALTNAEADVVTLRAENDQLKTQITELTTTKDAIMSEAQDLRAAVESKSAELDGASAKLAEIAAKEEAAAKTARYETRVAELPPAYVAALAKRSDEEKARFTAKWTDASSEEWTEFKSEIATAFSSIKVSYLDRTLNEGGALMTAALGSDDVAEKLSNMKR